MKKLYTKITLALAIIALFGAGWKTIVYLDQYFNTTYALAQETKQSIQAIKQDQEQIKLKQEKESKRFDLKLLSDYLKSLNERIWQIRTKIENRRANPSDKKDLMDLEDEKIQTQKKMDILQQDIK